MDDQTTIVVKALNLTWDEFCKQHAGASRAHADEIIRISPQSYRAILWGRPSQSVVCHPQRFTNAGDR